MKINGECRVFARKSWQLLTATLLALVLWSPGNSNAQSGATATAANASAQAEKAVKPPAKTPAGSAANASAKGPHEGITAHGYWVIDVRNPDGKLAKHMEFENQLCTAFTDPYGGGGPGGDSILASLLGGTSSIGAWSVVVGAPDAAGLAEPNCAIAPYYYLPQQSALAASLYGTPCISLPNKFSCGVVDGFPLSMTCQFGNPDGQGYTLPGSQFITNRCNGNVTESPASGSPGIILSAQFVATKTVTISAVGTELFTCSGSPGPPKPADCLNIGTEAVSLLGVPNTPCTINGTPPRPGSSSVTFTGCVPGDAQSSITINSETVANIPGRSPFSGVVLTGTNGVPAAFLASTGQTVAITWTLSFQ